MKKNHESIHLFRKNRETDDATQGQLTKEDSLNSEKQIPELIISPLDHKDKEISLPTSSEESPLPPGIQKIIKKALEVLGINLKDKFLLDSLKDKDAGQK